MAFARVGFQGSARAAVKGKGRGEGNMAHAPALRGAGFSVVSSCRVRRPFLQGRGRKANEDQG
eukprot:137394-Lingulodinium_polyedra.AAC.1